MSRNGGLDPDPRYVPGPETRGERRERIRRNSRKHVVSNRSVFILAALTGVARKHLVRKGKGTAK